MNIFFEVRHFLESEVTRMKENSEIQEDLGNGGKVKNWLQDNIRVILSVLIVATIMAGIYSYSKRTVVPTGDVDNGTEINLSEADTEEKDKDDNNAVVVVGEDNEDNKTEKTEEKSSEKLSVEQVKEENHQAEEVKKVEEVKKPEEAKKVEEKQIQKDASEETDSSFDETAETGDSLTVLARRATKHYLEKNPTEGLSAEHKIYIEDYLRKQVGHSAGVNMGEKVSFSKDLISKAVDASKNLNEKQLNNLKKYSARVNGL